MAVKRMGDGWGIDIRVGGQRIRRKIGPDKKTATDAARAIQVQAAQGKWLGIEEVEPITFKEFWTEKFKPRMKGSPATQSNYKKNARLYFLPAFGRMDLRRIRPEHIEEYLAGRLADAKASTVKLEFTNLKTILNAAVRWGYLDRSPAKDVRMERVPEKEIQPLTVDEVRRLYAAVDRDDWFYCFLVFALNTGMRVGEILNTTWNDVDFERRQIAVTNNDDTGWKTKSRLNRYIPMTGFLFDVLAARGRQEGNPYVFPSFTKKRTGQPVHEDVPLNRLKVALKTAGLSAALRVHDLRHTFGTRLAERNVDPRSIMELMGHSDISMTMRYLHTNAAKKRAAVERLGFDDQPILSVQKLPYE